MSRFLEYATNLALKSIDEGGEPFGACIVYDGKIIAEGVNLKHITHDVTDHAEMIAIKQAQKVLNTMDLSGCTMYASAYPCPMCMGAIGFSKIKKVYYANSLEDAAEVGLGLSLDIYNVINKVEDQIGLEIIHQPNQNDAFDPMVKFKNKDNN